MPSGIWDLPSKLARQSQSCTQGETMVDNRLQKHKHVVPCIGGFLTMYAFYELFTYTIFCKVCTTPPSPFGLRDALRFVFKAEHIRKQLHDETPASGCQLHPKVDACRISVDLSKQPALPLEVQDATGGITRYLDGTM